MVDIRWRSTDGRRMRIRRVSPIQNKRGAHDYEREVLRALVIDGPDIVNPRKEVPLLKNFVREFLSCVAVNNRASTLESRKMICRVHLVPFFGRMRLDAIGKREIERYKRQKLKDGLNPKTINNQLSALRCILRLAEDYEIIQTIPRIRWLKAPKAGFDFLDFDEAEAFLEAARAEPNWFPMHHLALRTGMRLGELRGLQWPSVDLKCGRLTVERALVREVLGPPKNGRTRTIPLRGETHAIMTAHRHLRGKFVFCKESGLPTSRNTARNVIWRTCKRAGLRQFGWHTLRHTFASHLAMKGVPMRVIQELMGHATIEMTMRYAHLAPNVMEDAIELLEGTYGAQEEDRKAKVVKLQ